MRLSVGEIMQLAGMTIVLAGGCAMIMQGLCMKRTKESCGFNSAFVSLDKIEDPQAFYLYLGRQFIIHGIVTIIMSLICAVFVLIKLDGLIVISFIFINIIIYFVRISRLPKRFYKA